MKVQKGLRIRLKIRLAVHGGDELEKSVVEYFQGGGTMLPGLEAAIEGMSAGDKKSGTISAKDAFGSQSHKKTISRNEFPKDADLKKGERFAAKGADGQDVMLQIENVTKESVDVLYLHPLHDADIDFDAEVLAVTDPAPPPLPASAVTSDD